MEPRFGHDFSRVRVHADAAADRSARAVSARAYTMDQHIVFGSGEYQPGTAAGRRLLAHELTHVVQQTRGAAPHVLQRQHDDTNPLNFPKEVVEMPWTGVKGSTSKMGYLRDLKYFWRQYTANPEWAKNLSPTNRQLIKDGLSPKVDDTWIKNHPQHAKYKGQILVHHHIGQASRTVAIPEDLHHAHNVMHQQMQTVGSPKTTGTTSPDPVDKKRTATNVQEHSRKRGTKPARIRGKGITLKQRPKIPKIPPASAMAGMDPKDLRPVSEAEKADIARVDPATGEVRKPKPPRASTQDFGPKLKAAAKRGAKTLGRQAVSLRSLRFVGAGLSVVGGVTAIFDVAKFRGQAASLLAGRGSVLSPYIDIAEALEQDSRNQRIEYAQFTDQFIDLSDALSDVLLDEDASRAAILSLQTLNVDLESLHRDVVQRFNMTRDGLAEAEAKLSYAKRILSSQAAQVGLAVATRTTVTIWEIQGAHDDLQRIIGHLRPAVDDYAELKAMVEADVEFTRNWQIFLQQLLTERAARAKAQAQSYTIPAPVQAYLKSLGLLPE